MSGFGNWSGPKDLSCPVGSKHWAGKAWQLTEGDWTVYSYAAKGESTATAALCVSENDCQAAAFGPQGEKIVEALLEQFLSHYAKCSMVRWNESPDQVRWNLRDFAGSLILQDRGPTNGEILDIARGIQSHPA